MQDTAEKVTGILLKCDATNGLLTPAETVRLADYIAELEDRIIRLETKNEKMSDALQQAYADLDSGCSKRRWNDPAV
jgi:hypothetical protein